MSDKSKVLEIGGVRFNADHLRKISEKQAILDYAHLDRNKVINAHKQANGKTVRNYSKKAEDKKSESKAAPKKTAKKSTAKKSTSKKKSGKDEKKD